MPVTCLYFYTLLTFLACTTSTAAAKMPSKSKKRGRNDSQETGNGKKSYLVTIKEQDRDQPKQR
jgi:hypothetical protein